MRGGIIVPLAFDDVGVLGEVARREGIGARVGHDVGIRVCPVVQAPKGAVQSDRLSDDAPAFIAFVSECDALSEIPEQFLACKKLRLVK